MSERIVPAIEARLARGEPVVLVRVTAVWGSTPRAAGTRMAVAPDGIEGTIGGGQLEWEVIARAREMIRNGEGEAGMDMPLGPALGQCCGGRMSIALEKADDRALARFAREEQADLDHEAEVAIFGAGHVGTALAAALAPLPVRLTWWDRREDYLPGAPGPGMTLSTGDPLAVVRKAAPGAAIVIVTHNHALDYEIAEAALARADLAYVGMIGSRTKRARFEKWFTARGGDRGVLARFVSPIGDAGVTDKRPPVIAALTVSEILKTLARHEAGREGAMKSARPMAEVGS